MKLLCKPYREQLDAWPSAGRHILAQFDDQTVVVYQAYGPAIGLFAARHGHFGGEFSLRRMSWIKPNFLWMMYRCGWATKPGQQVVLAVHIRRSAFDGILAQAVHSGFVADVYGTREAWKQALRRSSVRLQWDPDHAPGGAKLERRAIQLGLRGEVLEKYAREWIVDIEDITDFVTEQRAFVGKPAELVTPAESVYPARDPAVRDRLGLAAAP